MIGLFRMLVGSSWHYLGQSKSRNENKSRIDRLTDEMRDFSIDLQSLDFVINRFFIKLFATSAIEIVKYCQEYFGFSLPSVLWTRRVSKFESSFVMFIADE